MKAGLTQHGGDKGTYALALRLLCLGLVCAASLGATAATTVATGTHGFTPAELQQVLSLGPWPPPVQRDPSNRVSGQPLAITLGRQLFRDPRMSPVGYIACVTCHQPDRAFTDHKARAHGLADLPRNTPTLTNLAQQRWFGWGGGSDSLWMASITPILDPREFDGSAASVLQLFEREPALADCYRDVFGTAPRASPQRTVVNVGKALAAYVETLVTARTPFDEFRDALQRHDTVAAATYPADAQRGLKLFVGTGGCVACHSGPNFSDGSFHRGAVSNSDAGRWQDAQRLKASALNLAGPHNDEPNGKRAADTRRLVAHSSMRDHYRTPSLRNVSTSGPYLHDGAAGQLHDAVQHVGSTSILLATSQVQDLVAFLHTLTDRHGERRPWAGGELATCR